MGLYGSGSGSSSTTGLYGGAAPHTSGGGSLFGNLLRDTLAFAKGIVPGTVQLAEHPVRVAKETVAAEKTFYSPLVHGQFGKFWGNVHSHPLIPLLDALSVASGAGSLIGGAAKAGEAAGLLETGAADFARPNVLGKSLEHLPTKVPGVVSEHHYSPNVVRRNLLQKPFVKATEAAGKLPGGKVVFGEGGIHDMTQLGRGERKLAQLGGAHKAGTRGMMLRQAQGIHRLLKGGIGPDEINGYLSKGILNSTLDHAVKVDATQAQRLNRSHEWAYVARVHPTRPPKENTFEAWAQHVEDRKAVPFNLVRDPSKALQHNGQVFLVHHKVVLDAQEEAANGLRALHAITTSPTRVWKWLVLANAPRYFVNNMIGNSLMLMAAHDPVRLSRHIVQAISDVHGAKAAERASRGMGDLVGTEEKRLAGTWYHRWYGGTQIGPFGELATVGKLRGKVASGLYGPTEKLAYRSTHMVGVNAAISELPQFQEAFRAAKGGGLGTTKAFAKAADQVSADPAVRRYVEKRAADWAGQYHYSTPLENALRHVVPFYSWDRHALRFAKEQVLARPTQSAALVHVGQTGDQYVQQKLGDLPDFMQGALPVHGHTKGVLGLLLGGTVPGRDKVVLTHGLNPLAAAAEDVHGIAALAGAQNPGEAIGSQLNPIIVGALAGITGQNVVTGARVHHRGGVVGSAAAESFGALPQLTLLKTLLAGAQGQPTQRVQTSAGNPTLYTHDIRSQIDSLLGLPVRDYSPKAAEKVFKQEHPVPKPKRRRGKASAGLYG